MLNRHKSRRSRAADLLTKYLKIKATTKVAKGAGKAVKLTAYGKVAKAIARRAPKKGWLAIAGGVGATTLAARKRRSASSNGPGPTPV
jgi:hypothetical protein